MTLWKLTDTQTAEYSSCFHDIQLGELVPGAGVPKQRAPPQFVWYCDIVHQLSVYNRTPVNRSFPRPQFTHLIPFKEWRNKLKVKRVWIKAKGKKISFRIRLLKVFLFILAFPRGKWWKSLTSSPGYRGLAARRHADCAQDSVWKW